MLTLKVFGVKSQRHISKFSKLVYKMTSNRIAFVFAIGLAILASFMLGGSEADPSISNPIILPDQERVDASQLMNFAVDL